MSNGIRKHDVATFDFRLLARKIESLINKSVDWPPNYHKTATTFPRFSAPRHSMNKLTPNKPAIKGQKKKHADDMADKKKKTKQLDLQKKKMKTKMEISSWNQSKIGLPDLTFVLPLISVFTYPFSPQKCRLLQDTNNK